MSEHIKYSRDGKIGTITIDRPEKKNAMTFAILFDFIETVQHAGEDDIAALVITGVPGAFCAGTDLAWRVLRRNRFGRSINHSGGAARVAGIG
ncbi:MAG: hypothetical protein RL628_2156 [Actinomycetota bacterium]